MGNQTEKTLKTFAEMRQSGLQPMVAHTTLSSVLAARASGQRRPRTFLKR
jgi:hypothetical protein